MKLTMLVRFWHRGEDEWRWSWMYASGRGWRRIDRPRRCIVHDETYTNVCRGCRADEIAVTEETA